MANEEIKQHHDEFVSEFKKFQVAMQKQMEILKAGFMKQMEDAVRAAQVNEIVCFSFPFS